MKLHRLLLPKLYARLDALKAENHRLKHQFDQVVSLEYAPQISSPLHFQGRPLYLPFDRVMVPHLLQSGAWQEAVLEFARSELSKRPSASYHLFDVGANIGLVTRQFLAQFPAINGATCVEPDPGNFVFLKKNTQIFEKVTFLNYALSNTDEKSSFYRESGNIGNYSLIPEAMAAAESNEITIECLKTSDELLLRNVPHASRLIWKSDTQGYDEIIATELSLSFWARVDIAFMELWPIGKPKYDLARLEAILDSFPRKYLSSDFTQPVSTQQIFAYVMSDDDAYRDLYMAK
jgi:FkbM family methyltransferase